MPVLLQLDSSARYQESRSRLMTALCADTWRSRGDDYSVEYRDLHASPPPHMASTAQHWPTRLRGDEVLAPDVDSLQSELVGQLLRADALVIGAPMYNYSMPSTLKAWIDLIHVPGVTAPFDDSTQPMRDRPALIVSARGAAYDAGTPQADWDHGTSALALVLGEGLGMRVSVVAADRTLADLIPALDPERADASLAGARDATTRFAATA